MALLSSPIALMSPNDSATDEALAQQAVTLAHDWTFRAPYIADVWVYLANTDRPVAAFRFHSFGGEILTHHEIPSWLVPAAEDRCQSLGDRLWALASRCRMPMVAHRSPDGQVTMVRLSPLNSWKSWLTGLRTPLVEVDAVPANTPAAYTPSSHPRSAYPPSTHSRSTSAQSGSSAFGSASLLFPSGLMPSAPSTPAPSAQAPSTPASSVPMSLSSTPPTPPRRSMPNTPAPVFPRHTPEPKPRRNSDIGRYTPEPRPRRRSDTFAPVFSGIADNIADGAWDWAKQAECHSHTAWDFDTVWVCLADMGGVPHSTVLFLSDGCVLSPEELGEVGANPDALKAETLMEWRDFVSAGPVGTHHPGMVALQRDRNEDNCRIVHVDWAEMDRAGVERWVASVREEHAESTARQTHAESTARQTPSASPAPQTPLGLCLDAGPKYCYPPQSPFRPHWARPSPSPSPSSRPSPSPSPSSRPSPSLSPSSRPSPHRPSNRTSPQPVGPRSPMPPQRGTPQPPLPHRALGSFLTPDPIRFPPPTEPSATLPKYSPPRRPMSTSALSTTLHSSVIIASPAQEAAFTARFEKAAATIIRGVLAFPLHRAAVDAIRVYVAHLEGVASACVIMDNEGGRTLAELGGCDPAGLLDTIGCAWANVCAQGKAGDTHPFGLAIVLRLNPEMLIAQSRAWESSTVDWPDSSLGAEWTRPVPVV